MSEATKWCLIELNGVERVVATVPGSATAPTAVRVFENLFGGPVGPGYTIRCLRDGEIVCLATPEGPKICRVDRVPQDFNAIERTQG